MDSQFHQWMLEWDRYLRRWAEQQTSAFEQLEARLGKLEQEQTRLAEQMNQVRPIRIDAVNYKIQELSVKELSGTLNIGLSAFTDSEQIARWAAGLDGEADDEGAESGEAGAQDVGLSDLETKNSP